jgi:phosphomethylpyrimidine synthase
MTRIESARNGVITSDMRDVALKEGVSPEYIRASIENGTVVITRNAGRGIPALGIGSGLRTKVNANIGTSEYRADIDEELQKLKAAISAGADAVMDLSTGGDTREIRKEILRCSTVPVGTVPIYEAASKASKAGRPFHSITPGDMFEAVEEHASQGVDFVTVHAGVTISSVEEIDRGSRIMGIVSRGGALMADWIRKNKTENPFYSDFGRLLDIARKYDMVLSLGDGLRPGCIADATDAGQVAELSILGLLAREGLKAGVQAMIEGPGHVPISQIAANVLLQKRLCNGAPFYVLGPLVTDIAPGYDHITSAIGGAIAASSGADFLCYVTPSEHLRLPAVEDVREGVIASRIAAHAGDIAKGVRGAVDKDILLSKARKALNWDEQIRLSIDPEKSGRLRRSSLPKDEEVCTMCGSLCAIRLTNLPCEDAV